MFGSEIIDVALGMTFIFLVFSLVLTSVQELIEAKLRTRASTLEAGMRQILRDPAGTGLAKAVYDHPLIDAMFPGAYQGAATAAANLPSYIPTKTFSAVVLALRDNGAITPDSEIGKMIAGLATLAKGDADATRAELEAWFDGAMERISGVYKRKTQWRVLAIAAIVAVGMNVNSFTIVRSLLQDKALRAALVADAGGSAQQGAAPVAAATDRALQTKLNEIRSLGLPIGWDAAQRAQVVSAISVGADRNYGVAVLGGLQLVFGWLMTIGAISLGAPFWFDALNKIMVVRAAVKPDQKSKPEPPVDRAKS